MTTAIRTLIVDDEQAARAAIRSLVADDAEIEVIGECADGRSALDRIRRDQPQLVFLDIQMPAMDGISVLSQLDDAEVPVVVFVTAYDQHAVRAFEVHAVDYLLKPFDDQRFLKALKGAKARVRLGQLGALAGPLLDLLSGMGPPAPGKSSGCSGSGSCSHIFAATTWWSSGTAPS